MVDGPIGMVDGAELGGADGVLALAAAIERLAGAGSAQDVAEIVRTAARRLSGADGVAVVMREGDQVRYMDEDAMGPLWKGHAFPIEACLSGWAIVHRERVVIPNVFEDPRVPAHLYAPTFVKSCVMTPVGAPEPIACIGAYWAQVREPSESELQSLDAIARATAVALENIQLRRSLEGAVKRAEASSRAKSDFLANMSHEIRTPLNGVVGALALLESTPLNPDQKRLLAMLRSSSSDLDGVLKDILDFARLQSQDASLETAPFHVGEAVRDVARLFELRFARKGIDFRVEVDPEADVWVQGDRGAIKQVIANLAHNALKFTDKGRTVISVRPEEGERLRFVVADTGVGVAEAARERIFGDFEQGDPSSTRAAGGLGLGLAIARRLVQLMGGELGLESRLGAGSIFTMVLALPRARPPAPPPTLAAVSEPAETPPRILVVDDHPTNRTLVTALLTSIGAEVVEAENGLEACQVFAGDRFDAILMDIQMPVMDGIAATRRIREIEAERGGPRTPIIILSANVLPEHVEAGREAGADRHLAKPISPALIFAAIQAAMDGELQAA